MNPLVELIEAFGFTHPGTYLTLFLGTSLLMIWRLEALQRHGLEGTAVGTLVMPYCSGLGNLIFVALVTGRSSDGQDVLTNSLVNNVTNLTLLLGIPALIWGLQLQNSGKSGSRGASPKRKSSAAGAERQLTQLSLLLTLFAALLFTGVTWTLAADRQLDASDGLVLIALFLFWQAFHVFDVLKHNVRQRQTFGAMFYVDLAMVIAGAFGLYTSIDWLLEWLARQDGAFVNASNLGWLSGWLMVVPNALLAFFYAARRRADIAYASQIGDGHICIPLSIGLAAVIQPLAIPPFFETGIAILFGASLVHAFSILVAGGLPRWMGWPLVGAYAWFLVSGLSQ